MDLRVNASAVSGRSDIFDGRKLVATVMGDQEAPERAKTLAHQMAAAPEMHDALKALTGGLPELLESIGYTDEEGLIAVALAAIAKAEGR